MVMALVMIPGGGTLLRMYTGILTGIFTSEHTGAIIPVTTQASDTGIIMIHGTGVMVGGIIIILTITVTITILIITDITVAVVMIMDMK